MIIVVVVIIIESEIVVVIIVIVNVVSSLILITVVVNRRTGGDLFACDRSSIPTIVIPHVIVIISVQHRVDRTEQVHFSSLRARETLGEGRLLVDIGDVLVVAIVD